jgi:hypothetical protein
MSGSTAEAPDQRGRRAGSWCETFASRNERNSTQLACFNEIEPAAGTSAWRRPARGERGRARAPCAELEASSAVDREVSLPGLIRDTGRVWAIS